MALVNEVANVPPPTDGNINVEAVTTSASTIVTISETGNYTFLAEDDDVHVIFATSTLATATTGVVTDPIIATVATGAAWRLVKDVAADYRFTFDQAGGTRYYFKHISSAAAKLRWYKSSNDG